MIGIERRILYLNCTISLLCCFIAWTISMEKAQTAKDAGGHNQAVSILNVFFLFAYSPCYNIGYNSLTYSKLLTPCLTVFAKAKLTF